MQAKHQKGACLGLYDEQLTAECLPPPFRLTQRPFYRKPAKLLRKARLPSPGGAAVEAGDAGQAV